MGLDTAIFCSVIIPVGAFFINSYLRSCFQVVYSGSADFLLALLVFDAVGLASRPTLESMVQSESVRNEIGAVFSTLLLITFIVWMINVLSVEKQLVGRKVGDKLSLNQFGRMAMGLMLGVGVLVLHVWVTVGEVT